MPEEAKGGMFYPRNVSFATARQHSIEARFTLGQSAITGPRLQARKSADDSKPSASDPDAAAVSDGEGSSSGFTQEHSMKSSRPVLW